MTWSHYLYAAAGFLLVLWMLLEEDTPIVNAVLMSLLVGPFIGLPLFVILLVCLGNWPFIVRNVWGFVTSLFPAPPSGASSPMDTAPATASELTSEAAKPLASNGTDGHGKDCA